MGKKPRQSDIIRRLREQLEQLGRLLNPPKPVPARIPVRNRPRLPEYPPR